MPDARSRSQVDISTASAARLYDAYQHGKNAYQIDLEVAEQVQRHLDMRRVAPANRAFHDRAIRYAGAELGMNQFLDIGTGMPQEPNTHQIAQSVRPGAAVVYVDNDPVVMRHAEALLHSSPEGVTDYIHADLRDPAAILEAARGTLDFAEPVAVVLLSVLHYVEDEDDPRAIVERLLEPLRPGSCLIFSHGTDDFAPAASRAVEDIYREQGIILRLRGRGVQEHFLAGVDLVPPGLVEVQRWRPATGAGSEADQHLDCFGAIGIKPAA